MSLRIENDSAQRSRRETKIAINLVKVVWRIFTAIVELSDKGDLYALLNYRKWTIFIYPFAILQLSEFLGHIPFLLIRLQKMWGHDNINVMHYVGAYFQKSYGERLWHFMLP